MTKYKLFHKPTGLWFCGKQGASYLCNQTSINSIGKLFSKIPHFSQVERIYIDNILETTNRWEWEVVTVELVEKERKDL